MMVGWWWIHQNQEYWPKWCTADYDLIMIYIKTTRKNLSWNGHKWSHEPRGRNNYLFFLVFCLLPACKWMNKSQKLGDAHQSIFWRLKQTHDQQSLCWYMFSFLWCVVLPFFGGWTVFWLSCKRAHVDQPLGAQKFAAAPASAWSLWWSRPEESGTRDG